MDRHTQPRVLVCDPLDETALEALRQSARVDVRIGLTPDELVDIISAYDGMIVRSATKVTADVIEAGSRLRVIARAGTGVDNIDIDAASEHGIFVVNTPGANTSAVVELTFALILCLLRHVHIANRTMKAGRWEKQRLRGRQIAGKTLGVIGYGRVGREVARLGQAFGANVLAYTRTIRPLEYATRVSLDQLLSESDIISLHTTLTPETQNLINADTIAQMKKGVVIVNTSRGGLIDEAALLDGLNSGHIAGAALDVFATEPPGKSALVEHPHVLCTPHIGAATVEAQQAVGMIAVKGLLAVLRGERPDTIVNPHAG